MSLKTKLSAFIKYIAEIFLGNAVQLETIILAFENLFLGREVAEVTAKPCASVG